MQQDWTPNLKKETPKDRKYFWSDGNPRNVAVKVKLIRNPRVEKNKITSDLTKRTYLASITVKHLSINEKLQENQAQFF